MDSQHKVRFVSASCAKVYYNAVSLHRGGIPSHLLKKGGKRSKNGYKLGLDSKFTMRIEKIIDAVASHKRVAFDLATNERRLEDLVRGPAAFVKRKSKNHAVNEKKAVILRQHSEEFKAGQKNPKTY